MRTITSEQIKLFREYLVNEEKAIATINKYIHDVEEFVRWLPNPQFDKSVVLTYKNYLTEHYAPASVNAALSSLNSFFNFMESVSTGYSIPLSSVKDLRAVVMRSYPVTDDMRLARG